jgi:hypothetical protein
MHDVQGHKSLGRLEREHFLHTPARRGIQSCCELWRGFKGDKFHCIPYDYDNDADNLLDHIYSENDNYYLYYNYNDHYNIYYHYLNDAA